MSESAAEPHGASAEAADKSGGSMLGKLWEFADIGYDTVKNLWLVQFYDEKNGVVGTYFGKSLRVVGGRASQYYWKDAQGRQFWHVRERFYATEIERFSVEPMGGSITLKFKAEDKSQGEDKIPAEFAYLVYAYHLTSKEGKLAPMGFVEFYDSNGKSLGRINNRWIIIEGVERRTLGQFPNIRLRVDRDKIGRIFLTRTSLTLQD